jgi:hypothetical protein
LSAGVLNTIKFYEDLLWIEPRTPTVCTTVVHKDVIRVKTKRRIEGQDLVIKEIHSCLGSSSLARCYSPKILLIKDQTACHSFTVTCMGRD